MSNKDLIERLIRDGSNRSNRNASGGLAADAKDVETRVGARVIRRRAQNELPPPPAPPPAAAARPAGTEVRGAGVIRRRATTPSAADGQHEADEPTLSVEQVHVEAHAPETPETLAAPDVAVEIAAAAPVQAEPAAESASAVAEHSPVADAPVQDHVAPAEPAVVEAAPVAVEHAAAPEAPAQQEAPHIEVTPEPVVEQVQQIAAEPTVAEVPAHPRAEVRGPAAQAAHAPARTAHAALASGLPRADARRPDTAASAAQTRRELEPAGRVPGLGKAVVRPPPGYDPNDPLAWRRRAPEAPVARPAQPQGPTTADRLWREEGAAAATPPPGADDGRGKRKGTKSSGPGARRARVEMSMNDLSPALRRGRRKGGKGAESRTISPQAKALKRRVQMDGAITVASLAHAMSVKAGQVIKVLLGLGRPATANEPLDLDTAQVVASEFDYEVVNASFQETEHLITVDEDADKLIIRAPVVTIMGHVDHGKTTLLDAVRKTKVAASEAGGITQHIGAYQVERNGQEITFIDTPGHEAFTAMRARGARITDIVVLVVAADDGVMPQTVEAINHAKAAGVALMVAVNKIDKHNANPSRVRQALMEHGLVPEEFGGETLYVDVSALKGKGIDELLDAILLVAEVGDYRANPERHAEGTVLEARLERGRGPVANVLVQKGTLKLGDRVVMGTTWGRVRAMADHNGKKIKEAGPSTPVEITGLDAVPSAGDDFVVTNSDKDAKALAEHRAEHLRQATMTQPTRMSLEDILSRKTEDEKLTLNLVVKSDVGGSLEAIKHAFAKIDVKGTEIKILHAGVGAVTESDVSLAHTYKAVVIGFNVRPDTKARQAADQLGVDVRGYTIIYDALDDVEKAMKGMLSPVYAEKVQSNCQILQTFTVPKLGTIAGVLVNDGKIARSHSVRLIREGKVLWTGRLASLRRFKDDVREVEKGYECGMNLDGYNDIKVGDIIESFTQEVVAPS